MVFGMNSAYAGVGKHSVLSQVNLVEKKKSLMPSAAFTAASPKEDGMVMGQGPFDVKYFLSGALAGGICCGLTHGALTPVDVVKTRIQLDPAKYNTGVVGFKMVAAEEGAGALLTGLMPTA